MLKNWFKIYIKNISSSKLFFLWNIIGLAIGMASVILAVTYYKSEYSYNRWIPEVDEMYELNLEMGKQANSIFIPAGVGPYLVENKLADEYCYYALEYLDFYGESKTTQGIVNKILNTQETFFQFFAFDFKYGDKEKLFVDDYSIAISSSLATRFFGDKNPVGDTLSLAHQRYVISGVYELDKRATIMPDVVLANIEYDTEDSSELWQENVGGLVFKKNKGTLQLDVLRQLEEVYYTKKKRNKFFEDKGDEVISRLVPLAEARFESKQTSLLEGNTKKDTIGLITGCSFLIFLLTVVNYISLNQANVLSRAKEFTLRRIIGASRVQLVLQLLFETVLNVLIALSIALVLVELSLPIYNSFLHQRLVFSWGAMSTVILLVVGCIICVGGLLPALFASVISRQNTKGGQVQLSTKISKWRMAFVGVQLVIAFFFLIAGWLVYNQVDYMQNKELGFKGENVYQVKLYTQQIRRKLYRTPKIVEQIEQIKGIERVGLSTISFKGNSINTNHTAYYKQQKITDFIMDGVDESYISMMGFNILASKDDIDADLPTIYVNKKFVDQLGKNVEDIVGEVIAYDGSTFIIKGVLDDFNRDGFEESVKPMLLFHWRDVEFLPYGIESLSVQIDPKVKEETLERLQAFWIVNVDYEYPFEVIGAKQQFAQTYQKTLSQRNMFMLWNGAVVLIALFGLYAVMSFAVEQRLKEIVIRKVLGASNKELFVNLIRPFIVTTILAYLVVIYPTYWLMNKWLEKFIDHTGITVFPFVLSFVVLTGLVFTVLVNKMYKAVQINIINYIKYE
ncbi:ABC transporter permease [Myroides marinus]|uniref:ABC transporter permease n=1 Tax=Myroides marinus TaxID=703342 RepID=UPI002576ED9B|nr:ABC transporter permease [Myroides marinus]MDM1402633.1 ABC transporter permease [Myroides marinus]MDM1531179.1 ABC transporter permease [Myroides marinus]MDM1538113.1 ABC transporter permease [Myroides marinus]